MAGGRKKRVPDYKRKALEKGRAVAKMKREIAKELREKEANGGVGGVEEAGIVGSIAISSSCDPSVSEHGGFEQESTASHFTQGSVLQSTSTGSNVITQPGTEIARGEGGGTTSSTENTDSAVETETTVEEEEEEFVQPVFFLDGSLQAELKGHAVDLLGTDVGNVSEVVEEMEMEIAHEEEVGTMEVGTEILDLDTYSRIVEHGSNQADVTIPSTEIREQVPCPSSPDESRIMLPIRKRKFQMGDIKSKRNARASRPAPLHIKTRRMAEDDLEPQLQPGRMYDDLIPKDEGVNTLLLPLRKGAPHCLVCYQKRPHPLAHPAPDASSRTETQPPPPLIQNLQTIFVLRKVLELPASILQQFLLDTEKHPQEWIGLCPECKLLVHQCFDVNEKIVSLLGELREHKEKIIRKIKKTHHRDLFNRERLNCLTCTRIPCPGHSNLQVTNETREYVYYKNYSYLSPLNLDNEAKQQYESQLKEVERLAKDSEVTKLMKAREAELAATPIPTTPCLVLLNQDMAQGDNADKAETGTEIGVIKEAQNISKEKKKRGPKKKAEGVDKFKYVCSSCSSLPEMTLDEFIGHIGFHHKRPYKCVECSIHLPKDEESVQKHWDEAHAPASLNEEPLIKYSEVRFVPGEIWTCKDKGCQQRFSSLAFRKEHEESSHQPIKYWRYGEHEIKSEVCRLCFMTFPSNEEWRLHRAIDHPAEAQMECKFCDKSFITKTKEGVDITDLPRLRAHLKKVHNKGSGFALNICDWCGQTFRSSSMLKQHLVERHNLEGNHLSCQVCHKTFPTRATLSSHKRSVHFEKRFTCEVCGLSSMARSYFLEHKFKLHKIRPKDGTNSFKCSYSACRYESYVPNKLQSHLRRHTDSRPYTCRQCGKGFYDRKHHSAHERIHAGTKPFRCETCGKTFAVQNYLYIHQRLSHQGRLFPSTRKNTKAKGKKDKTKKSKSKQLSSVPSANTEIMAEPIVLNPSLEEQHTITYVQVLDEQTVNIEVQQS